MVRQDTELQAHADLVGRILDDTVKAANLACAGQLSSHDCMQGLYLHIIGYRLARTRWDYAVVDQAGVASAHP